MDGKEYSELSKKTGDIPTSGGFPENIWAEGRTISDSSSLHPDCRKAPLQRYSATAHQYKTYEKTRYQVSSPGTVISLNQADTTELKKIPGIGSSIARMIVNYRKKLGAFYRIEQLQEIHLKVEKLRPWFSIAPDEIRRINLNKASVERMMHHPYINYYQARVL